MAVVKNRKGSSGVEGGKGVCYQWKEKGQCSKGDQCSFRHESNDRAQKPTPKAATLSEPSMTRGTSLSRERSVKGKSNPGMNLRQPCKYFLKGTCTQNHLVSIGILPNVNSITQNQAVKLGISVYSRIIRLMNNHTKFRRKATIPTEEEKAKTKVL